MKLNSAVKIIGANVLLIPYEKHHVPKYHQWMKSKELQELTASEPLTLEQEYDMQKSWREDEDKSMIGDTNIFITNKSTGTGEMEIMIAENWARGHKLGWQAVLIMLLYGIQHIELKIYEAKISLTNNISIQMFKKLGFVERSLSEVFQEVTLEKHVTDDWKQWLQEHIATTLVLNLICIDYVLEGLMTLPTLFWWLLYHVFSFLISFGLTLPCFYNSSNPFITIKIIIPK